MKKLDLTRPDHIVEFCQNYSQYKNSVSLPNTVEIEIEKILDQYNNNFITNNEATNQMIDVLLNFMKSLNIKIRRK